MKKKDNEVKWVWLVVTLAFLIVIVIAVTVEPVTTSQQNKFGFEKPVNNNNGNFGFDSKRKLRNNRNSSTNRYNRNKGYNSNNGWNTSKKRKIAEGVGVGAVLIFFAVIAILWMLIYSLRGEFDYSKKKAKKEKNSYIKTILWVQFFGLLMCMGLTAYEPHFAWGIVALIVLLLITACYWTEQDTCIPYGTQVSLNKKPINVGKQKYRIQIFLSGSWNDTAWGGNDKNVVISCAKDISENNNWNITKVRVRKGSWNGEIIKEFSRSSFKKLLPPIRKPPIKNPPVIVKKNVCKKLTKKPPLYLLDDNPVKSQDLLIASRQYGYKGYSACESIIVLKENGRKVVLWNTPK